MSFFSRFSTFSPLPVFAAVHNAMLDEHDQLVVQQVLQIMLICAGSRLIHGRPVHPQSLGLFCGIIPAKPTQHVSCKYQRYPLAVARIWRRWNAAEEWKGMVPTLLDYVDQQDVSPTQQSVRRMLVDEADLWLQRRVFGAFIALFECPEGTILVSEDLQRVYFFVDIDMKLSARCVFQETKSLDAAMVENTTLATPPFRKIIGYKVHMTLLPFKNVIITDGAIFKMEPMVQDDLETAVHVAIRAMASGAVISSLSVDIEGNNNNEEYLFVKKNK